MLPRFLVLAVLVAAFFFPAPCPAALPWQEAHIAAWSDGDTARLVDGRRLRLIGLDTPEMGSPEMNAPEMAAPETDKKPSGRGGASGKKNKSAQAAGYYAQEALDFVRDLTKGVPVRILNYAAAGSEASRSEGAEADVEGAEAASADKAQEGDKGQRDRFGRLLVEVVLPDGRSLNEELLREGRAFYYPHKGLPPDLQKRLLKAQREALEQGKGCWKKILALPEANESYVGNRKSQRFFSQRCLQKARVGKRNQVLFQSLEEAFKAGYAPARQCGIWPVLSSKQ